MSAGDPKLFPVAQEQLTRDDYYTPAWVFERMGIEFDLDVCAPPGGIPWIPAKRYYTQEDDGLIQPWTGRVWMNPPYSQATPWVRRFMEHRSGVMLIVHAKSAWHPALWAEADGVVVPDAYFDFVGGPNKGSIFAPVFFAAFGAECVEAIGRLGVVRVTTMHRFRTSSTPNRPISSVSNGGVEPSPGPRGARPGYRAVRTAE